MKTIAQIKVDLPVTHFVQRWFGFKNNFSVRISPDQGKCFLSNSQSAHSRFDGKMFEINKTIKIPDNTKTGNFFICDYQIYSTLIDIKLFYQSVVFPPFFGWKSRR